MDDQKLWDLLGRSPRPAAPPFFAARTLRCIEDAKNAVSAPWAPLLRWLAPISVTALLLWALIPRLPSTANQNFVTGEIMTTLDIVQLVSPEDYIVLTTAGWPDDNGSLTADF